MEDFIRFSSFITGSGGGTCTGSMIFGAAASFCSLWMRAIFAAAWSWGLVSWDTGFLEPMLERAALSSECFARSSRTSCCCFSWFLICFFKRSSSSRKLFAWSFRAFLFHCRCCSRWIIVISTSCRKVAVSACKIAMIEFCCCCCWCCSRFIWASSDSNASKRLCRIILLFNILLSETFMDGFSASGCTWVLMSIFLKRMTDKTIPQARMTASLPR